MRNYSTLLSKTLSRQNPDQDLLVERKMFSAFADDKQDILKYIKIAMNEVDQSYTQKTIEAGERVKTHLQKELTNVTYRYQGSVMTRTHIKGYSDIDLLTISEKFYSWDRYNVDKILDSETEKQNFYRTQIEKLNRELNLTPYQGNCLQDLRDIRLKSEDILIRKYTKCDISKPKSIKIRNLDLHRDVDIVTASWYDDVRSIINDKGDNRGVQIYNKSTNTRESSDYPFISINRINERSTETQGRLKKMIRFLKTLKADSDQEIEFSSFDINAICYNISIDEYKNSTYLELAIVLYNNFTKISSDPYYANSIVSVDGREYIFNGKPGKLGEFKKLSYELDQIIKDLIHFKIIA
ncbi:hypothetical protein CLV62_13139 [Dysgonomonas alginatilytica]|uniref:cGAS/DncV-like nucleotidyltransferase C-terminal helical domain-containing protein n=1 Tax=Dysgonomonas alginatilytica TaxID=1605892 RepID=A0A2V3PJ04_9BACT|nr:hypothetical protein [Dysgonomonas alginatilytica]PXV60119.1 hypothetical protein CLV62_13139 [Dysgonomonas alginatilytica]